MIKILIPENAGDMRVIEDAVQQCCDFEDVKIEKNTSMAGVFVKPNIPTGAGDWARWVVVDNREKQCLTEDFATLDGAMLYASDIHTTTEKQCEWDVPDMFYKELVGAVTRKTTAHGECPKCHRTVSLEWDTLRNGNMAYCPHCGSPRLKLHETEAAE